MEENGKPFLAGTVNLVIAQNEADSVDGVHSPFRGKCDLAVSGSKHSVQ